MNSQGLDTQVSVTASLTTVSIAALLAALLLVGSFFLTHDLFVLTEARSYIVHRGWVDNLSLLRFFFLPEGVNTRFLSMLLAAWQSDLCGVSLTCANFIQAVLLGACAFFAFVHLMQVTQNHFVATASIIVWALSGPVLAAALWQATQHDKLAMALVFATLVFTYVALERPRSTPVACAFGLAVLLFTVLAFNAKEIAFVLPFASFGLAVLIRHKLPSSKIVQSLTVIGPQVLFSIWYISVYFFNIQSDWRTHVMGGSMQEGTAAVAKLLLNLGNFLHLGQWGELNARLRKGAAVLYVLFGVTLIVVTFIAVWRRFRGRGRTSPAEMLPPWTAELYFAGIALVVLLVAARTRYPAAFYILIAALGASAALVLLIFRLSREFERKNFVLTTLLSFAALPYLMSYATHFMGGGAVPRMLSASRNFTDAWAVVRHLTEGRPITAVLISIPKPHGMEWYLFSDVLHRSVDQDLGPFLFQDLAVRPCIEVVKGKAATEPRTGAGELTLVLDENLRPVNVRLADTILLRKAAEGN